MQIPWGLYLPCSTVHTAVVQHLALHRQSRACGLCNTCLAAKPVPATATTQVLSFPRFTVRLSQLTKKTRPTCTDCIGLISVTLFCKLKKLNKNFLGKKNKNKKQTLLHLGTHPHFPHMGPDSTLPISIPFTVYQAIALFKATESAL